MKLILTNEVSGLGAAGDVVTVKDGYGRNYLLPRNLAVPWTKGGEKQVEQIRAGREARAIKSLDEAAAIKTKLESQTLTITVASAKNGRLFGSVSQAEVAAAAKAAGITIDRRRVEFATPVKSLGSHTATVGLHPEVKATVKLNVVV